MKREETGVDWHLREGIPSERIGQAALEQRADLVRPAAWTATTQRDAFEQRVAAQYARLFRDAAKRIV